VSEYEASASASASVTLSNAARTDRLRKIERKIKEELHTDAKHEMLKPG